VQPVALDGDRHVVGIEPRRHVELEVGGHLDADPDRIYEVIEAGTTASSQPGYDTTIGAETIDGTATLKAYDSFTRVARASPTAGSMRAP
jgi:hypothetical protein